MSLGARAATPSLERLVRRANPTHSARGSCQGDRQHPAPMITEAASQGSVGRLGTFLRAGVATHQTEPEKRAAPKEDVSTVALMPKAFIATASPTAGACLKPCPEQADTT
jgi:hypothetical protein